jgi:anti-sigma-K factor RskA
MSNDMHVLDLLSAYALGSLDQEEAVQVAEHLATCPTCRAELASYQAVVDHLALAAPDAAPAPELKQRILGGIQTPHTEPASGPGLSWWQRIAGMFRRASPAWGFASLVLVLVLVLSNLWWWQRSNRDEPMVTPGGMQIIAMVGTEEAPDATGTLVISDDGEYGTLVVDGLPQLDQEYQYQLWLIRDGQRTSGGVFSVNLEGYGALWISSPEPLSSYPAFGITVEPAGGSPGPTGDKVLGSPS